MTPSIRMNSRRLAIAGLLAAGVLAAPALSAQTMAAQPPAAPLTPEAAAVKKAVEELKTAWLKQDKAKLEAMTLPQLTYSHSDARIEDKDKFIAGVMARKATVKSLEYPEMTIAVAGPTAIVRHLWVSESEMDGKPTSTKIGILSVWTKQDGTWKLLARQGYKLA